MVRSAVRHEIFIVDRGYLISSAHLWATENMSLLRSWEAFGARIYKHFAATQLRQRAFMAALAKQPNSGHRRASGDVDADALALELRRRIRGEVRFDDGSRALYATDASNYRQVPI